MAPDREPEKDMISPLFTVQTLPQFTAKGRPQATVNGRSGTRRGAERRRDQPPASAKRTTPHTRLRKKRALIGAAMRPNWREQIRRSMAMMEANRGWAPSRRSGGKTDHDLTTQRSVCYNEHGVLLTKPALTPLLASVPSLPSMT